MAARIPEETIETIRDRVDIVDVVSSYLTLKRSGVNPLGLCPFHNETTPSFNVNSTRQIFHCFGCGEGGNVFGFLMRMEGVSFPEAVRRLGERVGVTVEQEEASPAELQRREETERLMRINEVVAEFYHQVLLDAPEGAAGRRYLRRRGYDGEAVRLFRLGFAPPGWENLSGHLAQKGFDSDAVRQLGLTRKSKDGRGDFDLFRNRLIFPITEVSGKVVAFGGRAVDGDEPKYLNSPESEVYHKSRVLYGFSQAREGMRRSGEAIVVEGYFDQMALVRAGFPQAVATCGTALTADHARLLKRYCEKVILLFDQDRAGKAATFRAMDALIPAGLAVAVVSLDEGEDPDSFLQSHGVEAFEARVKEARPVLEAYMDSVFAAHGEGIEGKARAVEEIVVRLRLVPSDIERSLYLKELAARSGLEVSLLEQKLRSVGRSEKTPPPREEASRPRPPQRPPQRGRDLRAESPGVKAERWLLQLMVTDVEARKRVAVEGAETLFFDQDRRGLAEEVARLGEAEPDWDGLMNRLPETQQALLAGLLVVDGAALEEEPGKIFEGCRVAVAREGIRRRIAELDERIALTEREGDRDALAACHAERLQLVRQTKRNRDSR